MSPICLTDTTGSRILGRTAQRGQQDAEDLGRRTILCVDDDPVVLSLQGALLTAAGFSVITSRNAVEGLRLFSAAVPDAVVLDYALPGMTGAALASQMRRTAGDVPLILNSGMVTVSAREAALFDRVLPKGLAPALLVRVLREVVPFPGGRSREWAPKPANDDGFADCTANDK